MHTNEMKELNNQIDELWRKLQKFRDEDIAEIQENVRKNMLGKYYKNRDGFYKVIGVPKRFNDMAGFTFNEHNIPAICICPNESIRDMLTIDVLPYPNPTDGNKLIESTEEEFMKAYHEYEKKLFSYVDIETTTYERVRTRSKPTRIFHL